MSTKIYNGYKLPTMNLFELTEFILKFKEEANIIANKCAANFLANIILDMVDDACFLNEEDYIKRHIKKRDENKTKLEDYNQRRLIREASQLGEERYARIKATKERDPAVDFDCEICLIPLEDKNLVLFYSEQKEITKLWESYNEVSYYGYWNNTDPEENCTEEEWSQRERDWDEALPGIGIPSENGITIKITDGFPCFSRINLKEAFKNIPTIDKRAENIATDIIMEEIFNDLKNQYPNEESYRIYILSKKELKKEDNQMKVINKINEVKRQLVPDLDDDLIFLSFSELKNWINEKISKTA